MDILCYCVFHHQYRIQFFVLNNKVFEKVLKILQRKERWLVCAAIRFIRACLSTKDIFYNRYMVSPVPVRAEFITPRTSASLL